MKDMPAELVFWVILIFCIFLTQKLAVFWLLGKMVKAQKGGAKPIGKGRPSQVRKSSKDIGMSSYILLTLPQFHFFSKLFGL